MIRLWRMKALLERVSHGRGNSRGATCEPTALVPASSRRGSSYRELRATAHRRIRSQLPRYARQPVAQRKSAEVARFVRPSRRLGTRPPCHRNGARRLRFRPNVAMRPQCRGLDHRQIIDRSPHGAKNYPFWTQVSRLLGRPLWHHLTPVRTRKALELLSSYDAHFFRVVASAGSPEAL